MCPDFYQGEAPFKPVEFEKMIDNPGFKELESNIAHTRIFMGFYFRSHDILCFKLQLYP